MSAIEQVRQRKAEQQELAQYRQREAEQRQMARDNEMRLAGQDDAYTAVERELAKRQPIVMGSPEDLQMQADMDRGYRYATTPQPQGPSMFDRFKSAVSNKLGQAQQSISTGLADMFAPSPEVQQRNAAMGAAMKKEMEDNAYQMGMMRARESGDMSEDNINRLIVEEMNKLERRP
jgi:hypothetical protein